MRSRRPTSSKRLSAPAGSALAGPTESLPSGVSPNRARRALIRLGALIVVSVVVVTLLPGLGQLRSRFAHARPIWVLVACALEVLSTLAYVPAFRAVFCTQMSWGASYKIAVAEEGAGSLFPFGGAGSLALGVWALRRAGMPAAEVARKTVAFFLLTSVVPVATLALLGVGLATGVLPGHASALLTVVPAAAAVGAIAGTLALGHVSRRIETRVSGRTGGSRLARLGPVLRAAADGVDEATRQLRHGNPLLLLGLVGYLVFDILALWASFRAVGSAPELTIVWIGYLIGQLGNWLPVPGGIGGVEGGMIGILVLYGLQAVTATAAVLLYRVIELWIPAVLGTIAFVQLRALLRQPSDASDLCQPADPVEVAGVGPVMAKHSASKSSSHSMA
jgi:uncharacterized protein (TIRG00374 family)